MEWDTEVSSGCIKTLALAVKAHLSLNRAFRKKKWTAHRVGHWFLGDCRHMEFNSIHRKKMGEKVTDRKKI